MNGMSDSFLKALLTLVIIAILGGAAVSYLETNCSSFTAEEMELSGGGIEAEG